MARNMSGDCIAKTYVQKLADFCIT